jgi:death-on-curing protein
VTPEQEPVEYLTVEDLLDLARVLEVGPVRDLGLLDSAAHRLRSEFMGQQAYLTLAAKAAALLHSVTRNHALVDGNKRLGLLAMTVFLRINGFELGLDDDEAFELTMAVAAGELDAEGIELRLRLVPHLPRQR